MISIDHPAIKLFEELLISSPSGEEGALASVVQEKLDHLQYRHRIDAAGNIIVEVDGRDPDAPLVCFAAHMDEIGMVVTRLEADGVLRVNRSGGLRPWKLGEGPVEILGDEETILGVLSMGSTHTANDTSPLLKWEDCWIMTGQSPARLREAGVRPGTYVLPVRDRRGPVAFGSPEDPLLGAWTFDDRLGVVTQLRLLESLRDKNIRPAFPLIVAFTVSEEVGGQGAKVLAQRLQPEVFISIDGSPMPPETDLKLDGRPAIWSKDKRAPYDQKLLRGFMRAAQHAGTELQTAVYTSAASDASMVAYGAGVPRIGCVGHVRENSHGYEVIRLSVVDNLLNTLLTFIDSKDYL